MAKNAPRKLSAPALLGKIVGATVALPTAGLAYAAAAWQGVPMTTAVGRSVVSGLLMFVGLSVVTRILMHFLAKNLKASAAPKQEQPSSDSGIMGAEAA